MGAKGATGPTGPQGTTGSQGPTGPRGPGLHTVTGLIELHEGKNSESGSGWEAFRGGPGNYEVLVTAFSHEPAVIQLTAVSTAQANAEPPTGFPEPPVIADAEHIHFDEGFGVGFNINLWREGHLIDRPVYFTATAVGSG